MRFEASFGPEEVERLREKTQSCLGLLGLSGPQAALYLSVVDELCGNILEHGGASWVELHMSREEDTVKLLFRDDGREFDPISMINKGEEWLAEQAGDRGLGLYMVGRFADSCRYSREGGVNQMAFERKIEAQA